MAHCQAANSKCSQIRQPQVHLSFEGRARSRGSSWRCPNNTRAQAPHTSEQSQNHRPPSKPKVVVIGGGWAGVLSANTHNKWFSTDPVRTTHVNKYLRTPFFCQHATIHDATAPSKTHKHQSNPMVEALILLSTIHKLREMQAIC